MYAANDASSAKKPAVYNYAKAYTKCIQWYAYYHNCHDHWFIDHLTRTDCIEDMHRKYGQECFEQQRKYVDAVKAKDAKKAGVQAKK